MKHRLIKITCTILLSALLMGFLAPLLSTAEPSLPLPSKEQARETVMGALFSYWLLIGYYDDFCMTDEEWAQRLKTIVNPETCDLYRNWLKEQGLLLYETPARRVFDIVDPHTGKTVESLDMHVFPEGVTIKTLEALYDQYALKTHYIQFFTCSEVHDYNAPCYNVYLQEADGKLYGRSLEYEPEGNYSHQGPFTDSFDEMKYLEKETHGGSLCVSVKKRDKSNRLHHSYYVYVQMTEKGCRVIDSQWAAFDTFDYEHPHLPYDPSHQEIYEAAFKATFLAGGVYWEFPSTTAQMPQDEWSDLELRQFKHQWLTEQGLLQDWSAPPLAEEMGLTEGDVYYYPYLMAYPLAEGMTAQKFKKIARTYLAEGYVEQMFKKGNLQLVEYNGKLYDCVPGAGSLVTYDLSLTRIVSLSKTHAVLSFDEYGWLRGDAGTLEMTKTKDGWKATGGTFFEWCFEYEEPTTVDPPATKDDTLFRALTGVFCAVTACAVTAVLYRRKKRVF
ncbi:MAG: hypothetical protein IJX08_05490 [Clostridia bacterium]|nr:hypothetical protein [Clostridia bacterium]